MLTFFSYGENLSEKEFNRIVATKGDTLKLPKEFSMYSMTKKSKAKMRYEYSKDNILTIEITANHKTVEGKYLVTEAYDKKINLTVFIIKYYDKKNKCFYDEVMFPNQPVYVSKGIIKDKKTIVWQSSQANGGKCISIEKIDGKKSTMTEKYYDSKQNFLYNGFATSEYL